MHDGGSSPSNLLRKDTDGGVVDHITFRVWGTSIRVGRLTKFRWGIEGFLLLTNFNKRLLEIVFQQRFAFGLHVQFFPFCFSEIWHLIVMMEGHTTE